MSTYTWKPVALHLCLLLQQQGFALDCADNGEDAVKFDDNLDAFVDELTACDEAHLYVSRPFEFGGTRKLRLWLVFGNEPHETVADYTVDDKLEAALLIFEEFWGRRRTPLAEAEASWVEEVRGCFEEPDRGPTRLDELIEAGEQLLLYRPNGHCENQHEVNVWKDFAEALAAVKGVQQ